MSKTSSTGGKRPAILAPKAESPNRTSVSPADFGLQMALRQIGFDPARPAASPAAPARPAAQGRAAAAETAAITKALQRRDWMMETAERQRTLSTVAGGLPRVRDLSSQAFLDHFYAPGRPVIIQGAIADWPALGLWTPDYLRRAVGSAPVEYQGGRSNDPEFELFKDRHKAIMPFDRFLDRIMAEGEGNDAYITAYNSSRNSAAFAPLAADMRPITPYLKGDPGMVWIGPAGTFTPLHFDLTNNLLAQVTGRKRLLLVPPSETRHLAHHRHVFSDVHDIASPERLARYPEARKARRFEVELAPGDLLYIPVGWWHQVLALEFSVMLTYTDFRWPNDAHESFPGD